MSALDVREHAAAAPAGGLVPLAEVSPPSPGMEPAPGFAGCWQGRSCLVRAVLVRTAVVEDATGERHVASKKALLCDPAELSWREAGPRPGLVHRGRRPSEERRQSMRAASDRRALRARQRPADTPKRGEEAGGPAAAEAAHPASYRACAGCGRRLRPYSRGQRCTACQGRCPGCGGRKSIQAERCRSCARNTAGAEDLPSRPERIPAVEHLAAPELEERGVAAAAAPALRIAEQLEGLPSPVGELVDQLVSAFARIHELEAELERHREMERRLGLVAGRLRGRQTRRTRARRNDG